MSAIAWNVQPIVDAALTVAGTGLPVFFRISNSDQNVGNLSSEADQLGFVTSGVTGADGSPVVPTQDLQIIPQPRVKMFSMQSIGQSMGKLDKESRLFVVSHSSVLALIAALEQAGATVNNPEEIFKGEIGYFIGLVSDNRLYNVVQAWHREVGGVTTSWRLTCNATTETT